MSKRVLMLAGSAAALGLILVAALVVGGARFRTLAASDGGARAFLHAASSPQQVKPAVEAGTKADADETSGTVRVEPEDITIEMVGDPRLEMHAAMMQDHMMAVEDGEVVVEPGLLIIGVIKDGAAAKAGLRRGDVVLAVDGKPINQPQELTSAASAKKPGEILKLKVRHGDSEREVAVTLGDKNGKPALGLLPMGDILSTHGVRAMPGIHKMVMRIADGPAEVGEVVADGPAAKAGLKAGDKIETVDGQKVDAEHPLAKLIQAHKPGDKVSLGVAREGEAAKKLEVTLAEHPDQKGAGYLGVKTGMMGMMSARAVAAGRPADLDWLFEGEDGEVSAVILGSVRAGSPAEKAGLKDGDVITQMDGVAMADPEAVVKAVAAKKPGDAVKLTVRRKDAKDPIQVTATLGEKAGEAGKAELGVQLNFVKMLKHDGAGMLPDAMKAIPFGESGAQGTFEFKVPQGSFWHSFGGKPGEDAGESGTFEKRFDAPTGNT